MPGFLLWYYPQSQLPKLNSKSLTYLKSNRSSTAPVTFNIDSYKTYIIFVNHDGGNNSVVSLIYAESNPKLIELYRVGAVFTINLKNKTLAITSSTTYWNYTIIYVWLNGILNSKRVVVNGSSTQICLEKYKTAIVFGTVNTVGQSLILISRNYKDQIDIKSLCGASETSITGNVNLETENVTLNFSGNNSAIIIW